VLLNRFFLTPALNAKPLFSGSVTEAIEGITRKATGGDSDSFSQICLILLLTYLGLDFKFN